MDGDSLYSIGDLALRTGLTVKAIRFYADRGIVPATVRNAAGHRMYDSGALGRLELVRTLRELGLDLPTIRKVLDREMSLAEVAAAHAEALAVQIRTLRLRRLVLTAAARRGSSPKEMDLMHKLARLSDDERRRLIGDFLDTVFGGLDAFEGIVRTMTPELPDDPSTEQIEAWVELAELSQDADFRAGLRTTAVHHAAERDASPALRRDTGAVVRDLAGPALAAGIDPASPRAAPVVAAVVAHYADAFGRPADEELRRQLLAQLEAVNDPRRERYLRLLSVINGWSEPDSLAPALDWFTAALRLRIWEARSPAR
jgi:DNA-binding transcriptional MerR regulator